MDDNFSSLFEFLPIGAYRARPDGRLLRANPALVRLDGCQSEAELLALSEVQAGAWYVDPGRRAQFMDWLVRDGRVQGFESQIQRQGTRQRLWVSENAHLVRGADGQALYYEGTVEDISERLQARQALEASRDDLARMIDLVPGVVYRLLRAADGRQRFAYISPNVAQMFGMTPEQVLHVPGLLDHFRHPDDRAWVDSAVQQAMQQRRPLTLEYRLLLNGGEERWVRIASAPAPDEQGCTVRVGMAFDITELKRSEQRLRDNGELWKRALESTGDGVWDWDLQRNVGELSPQGLALFGYGPEDLVEHRDAMDMLTHPDDVQLMEQARQDHFAQRTPVYVNEHRVRCKNGAWKWVLSRGVVIQRDAQGRPLRMIGTHTDIDAAKQAEALRRERDRAAAADLAKSQFLSRVSHELRTPLNAILGFAQLLELGQDGPSSALVRAGFVRHILDSGQHLLGLVDDLLDLSAVQTGQLRIQAETVALQPLLAEVLAMFQAQAAAHKLALQGPGAALDGLAWRADRKRCKQILGNLLSNAIKYNRPGGWVQIAAEAAAGQLRLTVADSGHGLDAAQQALLFQPFERAGADRGPVAGTGLGLVLSRQLAEAMGGLIELHSTPGLGSRFTLSLPLA